MNDIQIQDGQGREQPKEISVETSSSTAKFLELLHAEEIFEVRIPEAPSKKGSTFKATASGYFNNHHLAAEHIGEWEQYEPTGIYCTLNPVRGDLLARSYNRILFKAKSTTQDSDVIRRRWILIDIDAKRPANISSTDAEVRFAIEASKRIQRWLSQRGWPEPIRMMSGNGAYLIYRVDLPNTEESTDLVSRFLALLGEHFNSPEIEVDHSVFNASRILKIGGTWARKGDNLIGVDGIESRPHRESYFEAPKEVRVVETSLIESVCSEFAKSPEESNTLPSSGNHDREVIERCRAYIAKMDPAIEGEKGSNQTLCVGATIERFGLSENDGWPLMLEYNKRCVPPWSEKDLRRKLTEGMKTARREGETGIAIQKGENHDQRAIKPITLRKSAAMASDDRLNNGPDPFPVELLPNAVRQYVVEGAESCYADPSIVALPVLVTLAACIGTTRRIAPKRAWTAPAILWGAVVARSGSVKSSGYDLSMALLAEDEDKNYREHKDALEFFKIAEAEYRKAVNSWTRSKDDSPPPKRPEKPVGKRFVVDDQTLESLVPLMEENPRGLYQLTDELRGFFDGMGAYSKQGNGGKDEARWLAVFDGRPFNVDRKQDRERYYVRSTAVSVAGTIQPGVLADVFSPDRVTSGMLARLLLVAPAPRAKRWTDEEITETTRLSMQHIIHRLKSLDHEMVDDVPKPIVLPLTNEAKQRFIPFVNAHGDETIQHGDALAAAWSKLEGYALRFALVDHLTRWAAGDPNCEANGPVGIESIEAGIELSRWFAGEAERVYSTIGVAVGEEEGGVTNARHADRLAEWLHSRGGSATENEIRRGPRRYRGADNTKNITEDCKALIDSQRACWENTRKTRRIVLVDSSARGNGDTSAENASDSQQSSPKQSVGVATEPANHSKVFGDTSAQNKGKSKRVSPSPGSPEANADSPAVARVRMSL